MRFRRICRLRKSSGRARIIRLRTSALLISSSGVMRALIVCTDASTLPVHRITSSVHRITSSTQLSTIIYRLAAPHSYNLRRPQHMHSVNSLHQTLTSSPRNLEIFTSLVNHLHAFARETQLTHAEWDKAIKFLTRTGKESTEFKNEFVLLSDCLGFSVLVDELEHPRPEVRF